DLTLLPRLLLAPGGGLFCALLAAVALCHGNLLRLGGAGKLAPAALGRGGGKARADRERQQLPAPLRRRVSQATQPLCPRSTRLCCGHPNSGAGCRWGAFVGAGGCCCGCSSCCCWRVRSPPAYCWCARRSNPPNCRRAT